jgi:hypothetical protein
MGSKASGKNYTSAGVHSNVSRSTLNAMRRDGGQAQKDINIQNAYWKGQNPWVTIDNPNRENTKERKIRVRANELWGSPKEREKQRFIMK